MHFRSLVNGMATAISTTTATSTMPTFGQIRACDGLGPVAPGAQLARPDRADREIPDCEPYYTDVGAFHDVLTQAGFELLEAKRTFPADIQSHGLGPSLGLTRSTRAVRRGDP